MCKIFLFKYLLLKYIHDDRNSHDNYFLAAVLDSLSIAYESYPIHLHLSDAASALNRAVNTTTLTGGVPMLSFRASICAERAAMCLLSAIS